MQHLCRVPQKVLMTLALAILLAATFAVYLSGFSSETLRILAGALLKLTAVMFLGFLILNIFFLRQEILFLCQALKEQKLIGVSRKRCRNAHRNLFKYLEENSLKGYDSPECRRRHQILERELKRHCLEYPSDFWHGDIAGYRRYSREVKELDTIW